MKRGLLAVLALTAAVYGPVLGHEFQFDDIWKIVENLKLLDPMSLVSALGEAGYSESATRFLPNMTLVLNRALFGLDPFGYHLVNLGVHITNVLLIAILAAVIRVFGFTAFRATTSPWVTAIEPSRTVRAIRVGLCAIFA